MFRPRERAFKQFKCPRPQCVKNHLRQYNKFTEALFVKYPLFLSHINGTRVFSAGFKKSHQILNFMKIRHVGAELGAMRTNGRRDRHDEANIRCLQFCECTLKVYAF